jgi:oxygen-independent coproporphyrinogen III oxidase
MSWIQASDLTCRAVPRYTSYPTAVDFSDAVSARQQAAALGTVPADAALSLYVHIPFCDRICWYCGCNTGANNRPERLRRYVDALVTEVATVSAHLEGRGLVRSIHFGGGSPNVLPLDLLTKIMRAVDSQLPGSRTAHKALEADPRSLTEAMCRGLAELGFSRVSLGAQTFSPRIQAAINRLQPYDQVAACASWLRAAGIGDINLDLMYGLPRQNLADLEDSLAKAVGLAPNRIALFGYAHLPAALPRQRMIADSDLPDAQARFDQSEHAFNQLTNAGYTAIGFDHFALPHDSLAKAAAAGTLRRNFQGFTDDAAQIVIGLGASAISAFPGVLVQNEKNAGSYALRAQLGRLAGARGVFRSALDRLHGQAIETILCTGKLNTENLCAAMGWPAWQLDSALDALAPLVARGIVQRTSRHLVVPEIARPYARLIAQAFDRRHAPDTARFSKAV